MNAVESKRKNLILCLIKNLLLNNRFFPFICSFSHNEKNSYTFYFFLYPIDVFKFFMSIHFFFFSSSILSSSMNFFMFANIEWNYDGEFSILLEFNEKWMSYEVTFKRFFIKNFLLLQFWSEFLDFFNNNLMIFLFWS